MYLKLFSTLFPFGKMQSTEPSTPQFFCSIKLTSKYAFIQVYVILSISRSIHASSPTDVQMRDIFERIEKANCLIELPLSSETINLRDLTLYIKCELNLIQRNVTDSVLQVLSNCVYQQLDKQPQIFYLLRLVLNIMGILTFMLLIVFLTRRNSTSGILSSIEI